MSLYKPYYVLMAQMDTDMNYFMSTDNRRA